MSKTITIQTPEFVFGDAHFRVLYGPPDEHNRRQIVGVVHADTAARLTDLLQRAADAEDAEAKG